MSAAGLCSRTSTADLIISVRARANLSQAVQDSPQDVNETGAVQNEFFHRQFLEIVVSLRQVPRVDTVGSQRKTSKTQTVFRFVAWQRQRDAMPLRAHLGAVGTP